MTRPRDVIDGRFKITVDDGYCAYTYTVKTDGTYSIYELYNVVRRYVGCRKCKGERTKNYKPWKPGAIKIWKKQNKDRPL